MAKIKAAEVRQGRMEVPTVLLNAATFRCQVDNWHDGDEMKPKLKEK